MNGLNALWLTLELKVDTQSSLALGLHYNK